MSKHNKKKLYEDYKTYVKLLEDYTPEVIVGFDETGNGALAGPLCVAGCALPIDYMGDIRDSKKYTESAREKAYDKVSTEALMTKSFMAMPHLIEEAGHGAALYELYRVALLFFYAKYEDRAIYILDGNQHVRHSDIPHHCLVKGDDFVPAISGASIVAKVERDFVMAHTDLDGWNFATHKGYPTKEHLKMLEENGPVEGFHRMSIDRVRKAYEKNGWFK